MANELMFQIGIQEVKEKIDDIRKKFDDFEKTYGQNGITVKLNLQAAVLEAETLIGALKNIGSAESLKPYESELGKVKQQMEQVANASKSAANAGKSAFKEQESTVDNLSIKYATLIQRIENWQANLSQLLSKGGHSNYFDSQLRSAISSYQYLKESVLSSGGSKEEFSQLRAAMTLLGQTYANVNKEAKAFNKEQERAIELEQKADSRAANVGVTAAEKKRAEMEAAWREQEQMQQKQLQAMEKQAQREEQLAEQKEQKRRDEAYKAAEAEVKARQKAEDEITKVANKADERLIAQKQKAAETIRKANERAINALDTKVGRLEARKLVDYSGLDTSKLDAAIKKIREIRNELAQFAVTGTSVHGGSIAEITKKMGLDVANREATVAMQALNAEKRKGAQATYQLTSEEQRLASAIGHSTGEMRGQSQVLSDLKSMAMQYVSVWGASNFLHNIIETGGLLEQQRLSIGAILQNAGQATELFGKIKSLALKSPFGVVELDKMSKQLTAYGFEYNELFDWTKRLADISAATGTSVDRLALALGHVRSEGALSGYTLRQFAMANVPVLRMLSENLGISTKEVRERVRKKDISYEDVQDILRQLTDKGGMFFEAQETMSQALNAKFKNLRDAFDIMYNEIAESGVGDLLKEWAGILTTGAKHWKELADVVLWTGGAFGVAKAAIFLYNQTIGAGTAATLKSAAADKQKEVNMLRLAKEYRALSAAEWKLLATHSHWYATSEKLTQAQLTELLNEKKLGQEELYRTVALKKINKELALKAALEMKAGTAAERHAKAEILWGLRGVQTISRWRLGWITLGNGIRAAGAALWSFTKIALPMAALSAIVELFARTSQMRAQAKEASDDLAQKATSDMKVLNETFKELQSNDYFKATDKSGKYINGRRVVEMGITFNEEKLRSADLTDKIENLKGKLQDLSPMYEGDLIDIDKMDNQVEQLKLIVRKLESIRHANDVTEAMSNVVTDANVDVAGKHWWTRLFGDTYTADVRDYEEAMNDMAKYVNDINEQTIDKVDKELGGKLSEIQKKYSLDSKNSALASLFADWSKGGVPTNINQNGLAKKLFDNAAGGLFTRSLRDQFQQLEADTKEMAEKMSAIVVNQFKDDPDGAIYAITTYMKKLMSMAGITDPRVMDEATRMMLDEMRKYLPKNMQQGVADEMQRRILMEQFSGLIGNTITESTKPEDAEKALKKYADLTIKWGEQMGYDLKKIGMDNAEAYRDGLQAKLNQVKLKTDWQKRASQVFVVNTSIKNNFDKSLDEFAQAVQKDLKAKQDYLKRNKAHLKMTLNIDTDILMNADKLKALMDRLALEGQKKAAQGDWEGAQAIYSRIDKEIKPYYDALMAVEEDKKWLKKEGYPETDPTKGKGKGSGEDKELKEAKTRLDEAKAFLSEYKKYREVYGKERSIDILEDMFPTTKDNGQKIVDNYKNVLEQIKNSLTLNTEERKKFGIDIDKLIADTNLTEAKEKIDRQMKEMERYMSDSIERFDLYKSLYEKTGNKEFAMSAFTDGKIWDDTATNLANILREKMGDKGGILDWDADKQNAEDWFKKNFENGEELYKMWEKIVDLIKGNYKNALTNAADAMKDSMTYDERKEAIRGKYSERNKTATTDRERYANQKAEAAELAKVDLEKLKDEINWDAVFGNIGKYTKKALIDARKAIQEYVKLNRQNMSVQELKETSDAVNKLNEAIADKSGLFGGLSDSMAEYLKAVQDLTDAEKEYQRAVNTYGANSIQAQDAKKKVNQAQTAVNNAEANVSDSSEKTMNKLTTVAQSLAALGKKGDASLSEVGSTIGTLISTLGQNTGAIGNLISAIFSILDMIGDDPQGFANNFGRSLGNGIRGVNDLLNINNNINKLLDKGDDAIGFDYPVRNWMIKVESLEWMKGANYKDYEDLKASYDTLIKVWDELIAKKKEYLSESWGSESIAATREALKLMQNEVEAAKVLGDARLDAGSGYYSHSIGYRMWKGSYDYNGQNWIDVAGEISNALGGVKFEGMSDMLNMTADQLRWIKENYVGLWSVMDDDFREYLEKIIEYGEAAEDVLNDLTEKLSGLTFDNLVDSYYGFVTSGKDANDDLAKDLESKLKEAIVKGMIQNLYQDRINALLEKTKNLGMNDTYVDSNGNVRRHHYDASGNVTDKDVASEYTAEEYKLLTEIANGIGEDSDNTYEILKELYGWEDDDSTSSTGSSIKGITESTADLIASNQNAIRADVSVDRNMIAQYFPMFYQAMTSGNASLHNIENHTAAIMQSNDKIAGKVDSLESIMRRVTQGGDRIRVS